MTTSRTGTSVPVVRISRHRSRACGELLAAVDEQQVGVGGLEQRAALGGQDLDLVAEQGEAGQHLGRRLEGAGQQQQGAHGGPSSVRADDGRISRMSDASGAESRDAETVTVRYWAAARAAAGTAEDTFAVDGRVTLAEVVRRVLEPPPRDRLARTVGVCSVLVGDRPVAVAGPRRRRGRARPRGRVAAALRRRAEARRPRMPMR